MSFVYAYTRIIYNMGCTSNPTVPPTAFMSHMRGKLPEVCYCSYLQERTHEQPLTKFYTNTPNKKLESCLFSEQQFQTFILGVLAAVGVEDGFEVYRKARQ